MEEGGGEWGVGRRTIIGRSERRDGFLMRPI